MAYQARTVIQGDLYLRIVINIPNPLNTSYTNASNLKPSSMWHLNVWDNPRVGLFEYGCMYVCIMCVCMYVCIMHACVCVYVCINKILDIYFK